MNRMDMAELVCTALELLDSTGRDQNEQFKAAFLEGNQEFSIPFKTRMTDWSVALRDTHLMAAYAIINEICLECEVPNHSTSTCECSEACTVLQTQLAIQGGPATQIRLAPCRDHLVKVDGGSPRVFLLTPITNMRDISIAMGIGGRWQIGAELRNQTMNSTHAVYIRASMKNSRRAKKSSGVPHQENTLIGHDCIITRGSLDPPPSVVTNDLGTLIIDERQLRCIRALESLDTEREFPRNSVPIPLNRLEEHSRERAFEAGGPQHLYGDHLPTMALPQASAHVDRYNAQASTRYSDYNESTRAPEFWPDVPDSAHITPSTIQSFDSRVHSDTQGNARTSDYNGTHFALSDRHNPDEVLPGRMSLPNIRPATTQVTPAVLSMMMIIVRSVHLGLTIPSDLSSPISHVI